MGRNAETEEEEEEEEEGASSTVDSAEAKSAKDNKGLSWDQYRSPRPDPTVIAEAHFRNEPQSGFSWLPVSRFEFEAALIRGSDDDWRSWNRWMRTSWWREGRFLLRDAKERIMRGSVVFLVSKWDLQRNKANRRRDALVCRLGYFWRALCRRNPWAFLQKKNSVGGFIRHVVLNLFYLLIVFFFFFF